ncbi:hypothetical protein HBB16_18215 [Pseudonocardia sp. MCCB 268]|nr:hypothetical protein [Pseudonocardia cytotoxica]
MLRLLVRWLHLAGVLVLTTGAFGCPGPTGCGRSCRSQPRSCCSIVYYVLVERATEHLRTLAPNGCSIYDRTFWRHEQAWKRSHSSRTSGLRRHPFKCVLAAAGGADRPPGVRRRLLPHRTVLHRHRRRLHAQRRGIVRVPLAGGRRVQVRPDRARQA